MKRCKPFLQQLPRFSRRRKYHGYQEAQIHEFQESQIQWFTNTRFPGGTNTMVPGHKYHDSGGTNSMIFCRVYDSGGTNTTVSRRHKYHSRSSSSPNFPTPLNLSYPNPFPAPLFSPTPKKPSIMQRFVRYILTHVLDGKRDGIRTLVLC